MRDLELSPALGASQLNEVGVEEKERAEVEAVVRRAWRAERRPGGGSVRMDFL